MVAGSSLFTCCAYPLEDLVAGGSRVVGDMHYGSLGTERFCKACRSRKTLFELARAALLQTVPKDRTRIRAGQKIGGYQKTQSSSEGWRVWFTSANRARSKMPLLIFWRHTYPLSELGGEKKGHQRHQLNEIPQNGVNLAPWL